MACPVIQMLCCCTSQAQEADEQRERARTRAEVEDLTEEADARREMAEDTEDKHVRMLPIRQRVRVLSSTRRVLCPM